MRNPTPVKASGFTQFPKQLQDIAIKNGMYPVNDVFYPIINDDSKILLLYGGYGSGKSVFIVDKLIDECLNDDYFRCFYGRKVFDTVRISVFLTITDRISERGLEGQFQFSKAENSSMIIRCLKSGGVFHPFGADNADKLKSVKDPSHILCEELDQFTLKDFGVLISRLRTQKVKTKFMGLFNTTTVKPDHWIKDVWFSDKPHMEFSEYSVTSLFCNYTDNYFINRKEYEQTLWFAAGFNRQKFEEISQGLWGVAENNMPWAYCYSREKHVGKTELNPRFDVKLSFDFNRNPITCGVFQDYGTEIKGIEQIKLENSNIYALCDYIRAKYGHCLLIVTGDATGRASNAMVKDNLNYYTVIKAQLNLSQAQLKVANVNPSIEENRVLVNSILHTKSVTLDEINCKGLIFDLEHAQVLPDGSLDKTDRKDPTKQLDALDCFRYYLNTFHKHALKL
jgi:phage terminase large subunit